MNTLQFTSRNRQITWFRSTQTQAKSIKVRLEFINIDIISNVCIRYKFNSFLTEKVDTSIDGVLFQFHVGDAIHK